MGTDQPLKSRGIGANSWPPGHNLFLGPHWIIPFLQSSDLHSYFMTILSIAVLSGSKFTERVGEYVVSPNPVPACSLLPFSANSAECAPLEVPGAASAVGASFMTEDGPCKWAMSRVFSLNTAIAMVPIAEASANTFSAYESDCSVK